MICRASSTASQEQLTDTEEGLMKELAEEQGKLSHTYDMMETSG